MGRIKQQVKDFEKRFFKKLERKVEAAAEQIAQVLLDNTELDSGLARANWQVNLNSAPNDDFSFSDFGLSPGDYPRGVKAGRSALISEAVAFNIATSWGNYKLGDNIIWQNNIPDNLNNPYAFNALYEITDAEPEMKARAKLAIRSTR